MFSAKLRNSSSFIRLTTGSNEDLEGVPEKCKKPPLSVDETFIDAICGLGNRKVYPLHSL